jgi:transducin (beta)-like 1
MTTGQLKAVMKKHTGPIFALKWNKKGDVLLTGSVDKSAIVWDPSSGDVRQQFEFHSAPCLDVDWRDDITFATCSNDKQIFVCQLGSLAPLKQFSGHKGEVNAVRWDPSGEYLASCSDDFTVKVWTMDSETPKCDFTGHEKEIYTIRWSPASSGKKWVVT